MKLTLLKQELFLEDVYMDRDKFAVKSEEIKFIENKIEELYSDIESLSNSKHLTQKQ